MSNEMVVPLSLDGDRVDPGAVQTARPIWTEIASSLNAGDAPTDLTVSERTYQTAKAAQIAGVAGDEKIAIYDIPRDWNAARFRAIGVTATGAYTVQVYLGTLGDGHRDADLTAEDCELAYAGELAWTIGAQVSTTVGYGMASAVTPTASDWVMEWKSASPASDRVAEASIDVIGADVMVLVPTVIGTDSILLARGY